MDPVLRISTNPVPFPSRQRTAPDGEAIVRGGRPPSDDARARAETLRRRIRHDIQHELGTIMMLASVVGTADDIGPASRARVEQILSETRWLDWLLRAYEDAELHGDAPSWSPLPQRIRVDTVASTVAAALRMTSLTEISFRAEEAWAHADKLALWRALRNVVDNAVRVAGPNGHVNVHVGSEAEWVVAQVEDDGPGFGAGSPGLASLGLGIVKDFVAEYGGRLELRQGTLGGGCVRILLRAVRRSAAAGGEGRAVRLVLCDDHSVFAESLALVLKEAGCQVVAVTRSPDDALAALQREPVDVCVLQLSGSPPDALDRLAKVRKVAPGTRIVLLADSATPDLATAAAAIGVHGFAYKDQHVADIIRVIKRVHRGEIVGAILPRRVSVPTADTEGRRLAGYLTRREREALCQLVRGEDAHGVANALGISWTTARSHIQSVLTKLGVHSRVEAATVAVRHGLVDAETGEWSLR